MRIRVVSEAQHHYRSLAQVHNLPIVYGLRALIPVIGLAIPTIVAFWESHGLTLGEIMVLEAFFAAACILFEVPAGYIADRFERRQLLRFGGVFVLIGILLYCTEDSFNGFLAAELLLAIGFSSISGADEALLYDSLAENDEEHTFSKHWARALSLEMAVASFAFVLGSFAASAFGLRFPFYLAALGQCGFILLTLLLREPERTRQPKGEGYIRELFKTFLHVVVLKAETRWLIWFSGLLFAFTQAGFWLYQPFFEACEIPLVYNGVILAVLGLSASAMALHVPKLTERFGARWTAYGLVVLGAVAFWALGALMTAWVLPVLFLHQIVRAFTRVYYSEQLHRYVDSSIRATCVSSKNIVAQSTYAVMLLVTGWIGEVFMLGDTLVILGLVMLIAGLLAVRVQPKETS